MPTKKKATTKKPAAKKTPAKKKTAPKKAAKKSQTKKIVVGPLAPKVAINEHGYNREAWLTNLAKAMHQPIFAPAMRALDIAGEIPAYRLTCGFPLGSRKAIGQCWTSLCSADGVFELMISPKLADDTVNIANVVAHEIVHAIVGLECGHKKSFKRLATEIGLEGKMTATVAGERFAEAVKPILAKLGTYPHATMTPGGTKKQTTRLIKVECAAGTGYTARMSRKWIDQLGAPICPCCEEKMVVVEGDDE